MRNSHVSISVLLLLLNCTSQKEQIQFTTFLHKSRFTEIGFSGPHDIITAHATVRFYPRSGHSTKRSNVIVETFQCDLEKGSPRGYALNAGPPEQWYCSGGTQLDHYGSCIELTLSYSTPTTSFAFDSGKTENWPPAPPPLDDWRLLCGFESKAKHSKNGAVSKP
jgi:hypothetical protein